MKKVLEEKINRCSELGMSLAEKVGEYRDYISSFPDEEIESETRNIEGIDKMIDSLATEQRAILKNCSLFEQASVPVLTKDAGGGWYLEPLGISTDDPIYDGIIKNAKSMLPPISQGLGEGTLKIYEGCITIENSFSGLHIYSGEVCYWYKDVSCDIFIPMTRVKVEGLYPI